MSGKMSVGVRSAASGPKIRISSASTTNVYGRLSAMRTSAIINQAFLSQEAAGPACPTAGPFALIYPNRGEIANAGRIPPSIPCYPP